MLIFIRSKPYEQENVMGALFIALSTAGAEEKTIVIFMDGGLYTLINDQNPAGQITVPAMSDIIKSLIGQVQFFYLPQEHFPYSFEKNQPNMLPIVPSLKKISMDQVLDFIISPTGKNLIVL